ncbi:MAG TPA: prolyl oligopeptidase family serine peptidase [Actinomycetota bacterium]|nr:prolyl oligopeptidase family serine peptidase [Actinomycetota bacterium]
MTVAAPFGTWRSPISAEMVSAGAVSLMQPHLHEGVAYWLEGRPAEGGRSVLVRADAFSEPEDITPSGFNARTTVHEYGGGAYLLHEGSVYFSNFADQRLYRQDAGGVPVPITPDTGGRDRYADGRVTPDGRSLVCVRERHPEPDDPSGVVNELVTLPPDGSSEPRTIRSGRDFYSTPRIDPDGSWLSWLEWDLPWMPWDGCELVVGELARDGRLSGVRRVAGLVGEESIFQPTWSPGGDLHFASDRTGWWNLFAERDGDVQALSPADAEFGWPQWVFGMSAYGFLSDGRIACLWERDGLQHLAILDPVSGELIDLDVPYTAMAPRLDVEGDRVVFVGGGPATPDEIVVLDVTARSMDVLRSSSSVVDAAAISVPRQIEFPTDGGLTAFAHFYPPHAPGAVGPEGERPPVIVMSHGGPTAEATPRCSLETQFWTSRGFAVVDVNYGGSTGFGRAYRQRLQGTWGVVDTADCINAAEWLASQGEVDGDRLLIRGGSAGGYTTLCALTMHEGFAAGTSYFGLADLESFVSGGTHKFESGYLLSLVGPYPEEAERYRARSPIHATDGISCPMLLLQGDQDRVVPPHQSEVMVEALRKKGLPYAYVLFEGEQHGFRKAESTRVALEAELSFYAQVLGFDRDDVPLLPIENL